MFKSIPSAPRIQSSTVQYIAFRYRNLKEGRDGAHLIASVMYHHDDFS